MTLESYWDSISASILLLLWISNFSNWFWYRIGWEYMYVCMYVVFLVFMSHIFKIGELNTFPKFNFSFLFKSTLRNCLFFFFFTTYISIAAAIKLYQLCTRRLMCYWGISSCWLQHPIRVCDSQETMQQCMTANPPGSDVMLKEVNKMALTWMWHSSYYSYEMTC